MDIQTEDRWLSTSEICQYLSTSNDTLYRWIQSEGFPAQKIGMRWKAKKNCVDDWILQRNQKTQGILSSPTKGAAEIGLPWEIFTNPLPKESMCPFTHVSLFSGCGGIDLGFRQAGFRTIFANDINEDACLTYKRNLGDISVGDIRKIKFPEVKNVDFLSAGFPCQPFSNAGSRKGVNDERGSLYLSALNAVEKLNPRVVMFENVRGLLSSKHEGEYLIEIICKNLDSLGYNTVFSLVDASKHNVPQRRLRVIIIAVKRSEENGKFAFPRIVERDDLALKNIVLDVPNTLPNQNELMQLNPQAIQIAEMIPEGGSWKDIPYEKLPPRLKKIADNIERYHWPKFYRRFHRDEVSGTITAAFKPENAGVWHPTKRRILSVREIARIQTFPDWFVFDGGSIKSKYQQIGNAVPPRLAYEVALQVKKVLNGEDLSKGTLRTPLTAFTENARPIRDFDQNIFYP